MDPVTPLGAVYPGARASRRVEEKSVARSHDGRYKKLNRIWDLLTVLNSEVPVHAATRTGCGTQR